MRQDDRHRPHTTALLASSPRRARYGPLRSSAACLPLYAASLVILPMMSRILDPHSWHRTAVSSHDGDI